MMALLVKHASPNRIVQRIPKRLNFAGYPTTFPQSLMENLKNGIAHTIAINNETPEQHRDHIFFGQSELSLSGEWSKVKGQWLESFPRATGTLATPCEATSKAVRDDRRWRLRSVTVAIGTVDTAYRAQFTFAPIPSRITYGRSRRGSSSLSLTVLPA